MITTVIIDFGNTRRQNHQNEELKNRLKSDLKDACYELPYYAYECANEIDNYENNEKHSFKEWNNMIFKNINDLNSTDEDLNLQRKYYMEQILAINKCSIELLSLLRYYEQYLQNEDNFRKNLKALKFICMRVKIELSANRMNLKSYNIITNELPDTIKKLFPELKEIYEEPYDEEELFKGLL